MTSPDPANPESAKQAKLPRRDWILLPGLGLLTIFVLVASLELTARHEFPKSDESEVSCLVRSPSTGVRGIPNSRCWEQLVESARVEYKFNRCGDRAGMECGPKAPDTYRIVMTGSSIAMGYTLEREKTIGALLPAQLSQKTGRRVEVYDEGINWGTPQNVVLRFDDVLAAHPDLILWVMGPWDIEYVFGNMGPLPREAPGRTKYRIRQALANKPLREAIPVVLGTVRDLLDATVLARFWNRSPVLVEHYLLQSKTEYVKDYLLGEELKAKLLRAELDPDCQARLLQFDRDAAAVEERARAAGVPMAVVLVPNRAQAAMVSMGEWPAGYDPYKLGDELRTIVTSHGGIFIDLLPDYRNIPNPEQLYLPVDGHPNAGGYAMITGLLAKDLTGGAVPGLGVSAQAQVAPLRGK